MSGTWDVGPHVNHAPKWLIFVIGPLDLIGMWFGEDERASIIKRHV